MLVCGLDVRGFPAEAQRRRGGGGEAACALGVSGAQPLKEKKRPEGRFFY